MPSHVVRSKWALGAALAVAFAAFVGLSVVAKATPMDIIQSNATATTSVSYMTPGTATTTYTYDSYAGGVGDPNATDKAAFLVQLTASSTSSVLNWSYQFSQNGIDWYDDNTSDLATTSPVTNLNLGQSYTWTAPGTATVRKAVVLPAVPTRYVRVNLSSTGAASAVWATFITQKQQP